MIKSNDIVDVIGIGLGPFNLSLAALASTVDNLTSIFFEQNNQFDWHPGIMLEGANLQVPFLADLVTLASPIHPLSFMQYLQEHRRLYKFYFLEKFHITREEYNHYCQWAASKLKSLKFNCKVTQVTRGFQQDESLFQVCVTDLVTHKENFHYSRHLALGIGSQANMPSFALAMKNEYIIHSSEFINFQKTRLASARSICVVGSGQSAAEIVLEILNEHAKRPRQLYWATRANGFFPMEYSKLGLEHFSPEYMQYFYHLPDETRKKLIHQQGLMYKGISQSTIADIFDKLYQLTIANKQQPLTFFSYSDLQGIQLHQNNAGSRYQLEFKHIQKNTLFNLDCDAVIMATGYQAAHPEFLAPLSDDLICDESQTYALNEDFSIQKRFEFSNNIYVQNNSLFSHGIGSPDLGLGCYRNSIILNAIMKKECYPVHHQNVFQTFGVTP